MKTMTVNGFTMTVTESYKTATLRTVFVTMPYVSPPGVYSNEPHEGRKFELASYKGGAVEVYVQSPTTGIYMYQGSLRAYAPGKDLQTALKAAYLSVQPSKAARAAVETSCEVYA